jgi:hypothetical protein
MDLTLRIKDLNILRNFEGERQKDYEFNFIGVVAGVDINLLGISKPAFNFWRENKDKPDVLKTFNAKVQHPIAPSDIIPIISAELLQKTSKYDPEKDKP